MSRPRCSMMPVVLGLALASAGCAGVPVPATSSATGAVSVEGAIASIDTRPWTYDGNAVIEVDTADRGRVAVQLPARWNLCQAPSVDMEALAVGMRVSAVGAAAGEGRLVVCQDPSHRLVPLR
ncbi:hypothetical protein WCE41_06810 [Luteimonas sp. MJ246]|uniref:hypothetical protein n=1 Tax=Luteimonas sp. MJ174 TaxID=3129237 RepID=UPI0031BB59CE